jgi:SAM-dependent methyltransferase
MHGVEEVNKQWWHSDGRLNRYDSGTCKEWEHPWSGGYLMFSEIPNNSSVLDLGCAMGQHGEYLAREKNCVVYGIDIVDEVVEVALSKGVKAIKHDLNDPLPYKNGEFDNVLAGDVFEHIYSVERLASECLRVLKVNGKLIANIPNYNGWENRFLTLFGKMDKYVTGGDDKTFSVHIQQFNYDRIMYLFSTVGYRNIWIKPVGRVGKYFKKIAGAYIFVGEK